MALATTDQQMLKDLSRVRKLRQLGRALPVECTGVFDPAQFVISVYSEVFPPHRPLKQEHVFECFMLLCHGVFLTQTQVITVVSLIKVREVSVSATREDWLVTAHSSMV